MASHSPLVASSPLRSLIGLALSALALAVAGITAACAIDLAPVGVDQARLGNVFFVGELVQIPVPGEGGEIAWRVLDFSGTEVARGAAPVVAGQALIAPEVDERGYYEVAFAPASGGSEERRAFAIIAPPGAADASAPSPFGVMTHFAQGWERDILPLIAAAGIRHIRDEQYWDEVEPKTATFVFPESYQAYMAEAEALGLEPLIVMSFENPLYDGGMTPHTDAGRAGYARYGRAILDQYGAQIRALEVWNEYNGSFAHGPASEDRAGYYTAMLKEAYRQIKEARPDVMVLGGAAVTVPLPWMEAVFQQGGLDAMDGVVVHPYRTHPEGVEREIEALRQLIESYNGGAPKPIWATEFGRNDNSEPGRRRSASYLVQMSTLLLGAGVERLYWYLTRDYQTDVSDFESMGLLRAADSPFGRYAPAPAYVAYANLIRELQGATYVRREPTDPRSQVHLFEKAGEEIRVAWSTSDAARLQLATSDPLTLVDLMGRERTLQPSPARVGLLISEAPIYLKGPVSDVREWRSDTLVADSTLDFDAQDQAGVWQYGAYDGDGLGTGDGAAPTGAYSDDDFETLQPMSDLWGRFWGDAELGPVKVDRGGGHPGLAGQRPAWAVRRWLSPFDATIRVRGELELSDSGGDGDGAELRILNDGVAVFSTALEAGGSENSISYDVAFAVRKGGAVDFAVTPGPDRDVNHDATIFSASITLPLLADSLRDFSLLQGANGWHYGYYHATAAGAGPPYSAADFKPFPPGEQWGGGEFGPLMVNQLGAHPGQQDGGSAWSVRRWVSNTEGPVRITGDVGIWQNSGDGVSARVLVDGEPVLQLDLGGPDRPDKTSYEVTATLRKGSVVDFALEPGPAANIDFDGTTFTAVIQKL